MDSSVKNSNEIIPNNLLPFLTGNLSYLNPYDILDMDAKALEERVNKMKEDILKQHKSKITQLPNGRYFTRLGGKKIERTRKSDLEKEIILYYTGLNLTIHSTFENYLVRRKTNVRPTTWSKDIRIYNQFIKGSELDSKPIKEISVKDAYTFLNHCKEVKPDIKKKYWNTIDCTLSSLFRFFAEEGIRYDNPFDNIIINQDFFTPALKTKEEDRVFSRNEQANIFEISQKDAELNRDIIALGIQLLFYLGIRIGELCALVWGDIENVVYLHIQREIGIKIDENGKACGHEILDHCKSPAGNRRLRLNEDALRILMQIKTFNQANGFPTGPNDYIFIRRYRKEITYCTERSFFGRLENYCKKAGMTVKKSPHDIRRTVITNLFKAGMDLKKLQKFAGHSSLKMTLDYINQMADDEDDITYVSQLNVSGFQKPKNDVEEPENPVRKPVFRLVNTGEHKSSKIEKPEAL